MIEAFPILIGDIVLKYVFKKCSISDQIEHPF